MAKSQLESRVEAYRRARNKQKMKAVQALFGIKTDPSVEEMAAFNKSLEPTIARLASLQGKVYDNQNKRIAERASTLRYVMSNMRALITNRATVATGWKKHQLEQYGKNMDFLLKGIKDAEAAAVERSAAGQTGTDLRLSPEKLYATVTGIYKDFGGDRLNTTQVYREVAKAIPDKGDLAQAMDVFEQLADREGEVFQADAMLKEVNAIRDAAAVLLPPSTLTAAGVDPTDRAAASFYTQGQQLVNNPDDVMKLFIEQKNRLDDSQPSYGGSMGATVADLANAISTGSTRNLQEAFDDFIGEIGLTEEEASMVSNQERHKESLLAALYNPNAPSSLEVARQQLKADPGFLKYKQDMGFNTDHAAFISLKREMRNQRKKARREDRMTLRQSRPGRSTVSKQALEALRQRESAAKKVADDASATASAQMNQVATPQSTTVNTGETNGRRDN